MPESEIDNEGYIRIFGRGWEYFIVGPNVKVGMNDQEEEKLSRSEYVDGPLPWYIKEVK